MSTAAPLLEPLTSPGTMNERIITIRIQENLLDQMDLAAKATGLKRADVMRLSMERGVVLLMTQLGVTAQQPDSATGGKEGSDA